MPRPRLEYRGSLASRQQNSCKDLTLATAERIRHFNQRWVDRTNRGGGVDHDDKGRIHKDDCDSRRVGQAEDRKKDRREENRWTDEERMNVDIEGFFDDAITTHERAENKSENQR